MPADRHTAVKQELLVRYLDFNDSYLAPGETCHPSDNLGAVLAALSFPAAAQEVVLKGVAAFQEGSIYAQKFEQYIKAVNEKGKGQIRIQYLGGAPKVMPLFDVGKNLPDGPEGKELFFVGDEFQSIYGFRHADVQVFRERREQSGVRQKAVEPVRRMKLLVKTLGPG